MSAGQSFNSTLSGLKKILQSIIINIQPSGLRIKGLITVVSINDTIWTPLPATPLTQRNAVRIQNYSGAEIKTNYDPTVVGYVGMTVLNFGEIFEDITDTILIYAKAAPGSGTVTLNVEEIS